MVQSKWGFNRVGVVVAVLAGLLASCHGSNNGAAQLAERLAEIRAAGEPVTIDDLVAQATPTLSDAENAAPTLKQAFDTFHKGTDGDIQLPIFDPDRTPHANTPVSGEVLAASKVLLDENAACLALVEKSVGMKSCWFPVDYKKGPDMDISHLSKMRDMERLLCLKALVFSEQHDAAGAYSSLLDGYKLGQHLRSDPLMITQLVRIALRMIASSTLEQALNRTDFDPTQLAALQSTLATMHDPEMCHRAFLAERCLSLYWTDGMITGTMNSPDSDPDADKLLQAMRSDPDLAVREKLVELDMMSMGVAAASRPFPQMLDAADGVTDIFDPEDQSKSPPANSELARAGMGVGALMRCTYAAARDDAILTVTEVGLALRRFQLAEKRLPAKLDELVPTYLKSVPGDPFDGKPIRYLPKGDAFTVYSIGTNRVDDGGKRFDDSEKNRENGDVTFSVERKG